jgi:hypothetical protein
MEKHDTIITTSIAKYNSGMILAFFVGGGLSKLGSGGGAYTSPPLATLKTSPLKMDRKP